MSGNEPLRVLTCVSSLYKGIAHHPDQSEPVWGRRFGKHAKRTRKSDTLTRLRVSVKNCLGARRTRASVPGPVPRRVKVVAKRIEQVNKIVDANDVGDNRHPRSSRSGKIGRPALVKRFVYVSHKISPSPAGSLNMLIKPLRVKAS
jgi:hypothetical protein